MKKIAFILLTIAIGSFTMASAALPDGEKEVETGTATTNSCEITIIDAFISASSFQVSQNNEKAQIIINTTVGDLTTKHYKAELYNLSGDKVTERYIIREQTFIAANELPKGTYLLRIIEEQGEHFLAMQVVVD
jgi:FlaG/FlaF family flagellin (archaellin)